MYCTFNNRIRASDSVQKRDSVAGASGAASVSSSSSQPVFGVPLSQCVEPFRKRSNVSEAPNPEELHSPSGSSTLGVITPPSSSTGGGMSAGGGRGGSRTSVGSIAEAARGTERVR